MDILGQFRNNPFSKLFDSKEPEAIKDLQRQIDKFSVAVGEEEFFGLNRQGYVNPYDGGYTQNSYSFDEVFKSKIDRIHKYRQMSYYPEIAEVIDNVCDDAVVFDDFGLFTELIITKDVPKRVERQLKQEFDYIINDVFKAREKMWELFRKWLIEGELYLELIKNKDNNKIIGIKLLPAFTMTPMWDGSRIVNYIQRDLDQNRETIDKSFDKTQIAYSNYGDYDKVMTNVAGYLESAVRVYNQLKNLEDALILYRMSRAPEKLVFNIETGNMPTGKAEEFIRRMIQKYKKHSVYDPETGNVKSTQNIHALTENFWFAKKGGQGTDVDVLQSGMNLGELEDVNYFLRKLYKALKLPKGRWEDTSSSQYSSGKNISREEVKFQKFVERLQDKFKKVIIDAFVTQLSFSKTVEEEYIDPRIFDLKFVKNNLYTEFREMEYNEVRMQLFGQIEPYISSPMNPNGHFAREFAMKKYFRMSEDEWIENEILLKKENEENLKIAQQQGINQDPYNNNPFNNGTMNAQLPPPENGSEEPTDEKPDKEQKETKKTEKNQKENKMVNKPLITESINDKYNRLRSNFS